MKDEIGRGTLYAEFTSPDGLAALRAADVVYGVDVIDGKNYLFFGMATLERIARGDRARELAIAKYPVDFSTDDVEVLAEACLSFKGSCCYNLGPGEADRINPAFN